MKVIPADTNRDWRKTRAVVFQSDDWGYCGWMPDEDVFKKMKPMIDRMPNLIKRKVYRSTLESTDDLESLFELLEGFQDAWGRHPVFQAAYVMCNPDYENMRKIDYSGYMDIPLPELPLTWQRGDIISKAREGIHRGVWQPVYHGNSHFNVNRWIKTLQTDTDVRKAADSGCFVGFGKWDEYEFGEADAMTDLKSYFERGIAIFEKNFSLKPVSAILPAYVWPIMAEKEIVDAGIRILQGKNLQILTPSLKDKIRGKLFNLMGYRDAAKLWQIEAGDYRSDIGLHYLTRNVYFEPYLEDQLNEADFVEKNIARVKRAWHNDQPAIITTHRANFASLDHAVTERGKRLLKIFIHSLLEQYSDLSFLTDSDLIKDSKLNGNK